MTGTEKEFITFAIVTRGTKASLEGNHLDAQETLERNSALSASFWTCLKTVVVRFGARLCRKSLCGLRGPHLYPSHYLRFAPLQSG